jgi:hypothetical protein
MTAAAMMTTMIRMMRNMAWLPWVTSWALAAGRLFPGSAPNLHWKFITGNLILELAIDEEARAVRKEEVLAS